MEMRPTVQQQGKTPQAIDNDVSYRVVCVDSLAGHLHLQGGHVTRYVLERHQDRVTELL